MKISLQTRGSLRGSAALLFGLGAGLVTWTSHGQINAWIKPTSGAWEEPQWTLETLPGPGQTVAITNAGWKAVAIGSTTVSEHASTLTIEGLQLNAPPDSMNVLLLNYSGTEVPLRVEGDVEVGLNGRIDSLYSGLSVGGDLHVWNGEIDQDWGATLLGGLLDLDGAYYLTNGLLQATRLVVASTNSADFVQYGGQAEVGTVLVGVSGAPPVLIDGNYFLYGGTLASTNLQVGGGTTFAKFRQEGGTNQTGLLQVPVQSAPSRYELTGGLLQTTESDVFGSANNSVEFDQTGGMHVIPGGTLRIEGGEHGGFLFYPGFYNLNGGDLSAELILIGGYAIYTQTNGTATATRLALGGGSGFARMQSVLAGGVLSVGRVDFGPLGVDLLQTGGELNVGTVFAYGGVGPRGPEYATYTLLGGMLNAPDIELNANIIVSGTPARIANSGYFKLGGSAGGTLTLSNAVEHLGTLILERDSALVLGGGSAKLFFADSSAEPWNSAAQLYIRNWNGAVTGGGADRVVFGNGAGGLSINQLQQLRFVDAAGFPGTNFATILPTGEVVPTIPPYLFASRQGNSLSLSWTGNFVLQTSTSVQGPYVAVPGAISPFVVNTTTNVTGFFRLAPAGP